MKLKKIVSLAMAGVLAVSMLAGCNNGTGSSSSTTEQPAAKDLVSQVVAGLQDELNEYDAKVTVSADAELQKALENLAANVGTAKSSYTYTNLYNMDNSFGYASFLDKVENGRSDTSAASKEEQYALWAGMLDTSDAEVSYNAKKIVAEAMNWTCVEGGKKLDTLAVSDRGTVVGSAEYTNTKGDKVYYSFEYTLKVAVVPVSNAGDSSVTGGMTGTTSGYAYAFYLTRTPTEMPL